MQNLIHRVRGLRRLYACWTVLCVAWLCAGCEEAPLATEVLVVIDGDANLAAQLSRLEVRVYDGTTLDTPVQPLQIALGNGDRQHSLPLSFSIAPTDQDDTRAFRVLVTGFDAQSRVLVEQQVLTSFHPNYAGRLDVHLYGGCTNACREGDKPGTLTCSQNGVCEAIPQRNELPAATTSDLGGYSVVMMGTQDAGTQGGADAGIPGNQTPGDTGSIVPEAATASEAGGPVPSADASTSPPVGDAGGSANDASVAVDARADAATNVDAARDADADADMDAASPDAAKFSADPEIPAAPASCPTFQSGNIAVSGMNFTIWAGARGPTKGPLLMYWHGTGGAAGNATMLPAAVRDDIVNAGGLLVSAAASVTTGGSDTSGTGVWFAEDNNVVDVLVACAVRDHNIDPRRIYATGVSSGGLHAGSMAFLRAKYMAAVSANSGGLVSATYAAVQPGAKRVAAGMTMHGGASDQVIVSFSATSQTMYTNLKAQNALAINCDHGGGHGMAPALLQTAAWQFMKDHPFGVTPEPYASGLPASFPSYCSIK